MHRLDSVFSLKKSISGSRWQTLRGRLLAYRGIRCEKCGVRGKPIDAHEIWEYTDAEVYGFELTEIRNILDEWNIKQEAFWTGLHVRLRTRDPHLGSNNRGPVGFERCDRAVVQVLTEIQLLCQRCHRRLHYGAGSSASNHSLVIHAEFSGFAELPDFKTYQEWEQHQQDETQLYIEAAAGWPFESRGYDADI